MRTRYLVSYDICDDKRLRRVAKTLEGYGERLQYSLFECPLDRQRCAELRSSLHEIINHDEDQVLFVSLGSLASDDNVTIEALGLPYRQRTRISIV